MEKKDYYSILGISKQASQDEIKAAYRKMALKYHPDRNQDPDKKTAAEKKFKEAAQAYEVLSNPDKRKNYDQMGHDSFEQYTSSGGASSGAHYQGMNMDDIFANFSDVFGDLFGGGSARGQKRRSKSSDGLAAERGHDLAKEIEITLKDSYLGTEQEFSYYRFFSCDSCAGKGSTPGTKISVCPHCQGAGQMQYRQGFFMYAQTCAHCSGQGKIISSPCTTCRGKSRIQKYDTFHVTIPVGVHNNSEIRVQGKGDAGIYGGPYGDLFIKISIKPDKKFKRVQDNLVCTVTLTYPQLVLGCQIEVENIDGTKEMVKIPRSCPVGEELSVKGKGFRNVRTSIKGNLVLITKCHIPQKISTKAKDLLVEFSQEIGTSTQSSLSDIASFFKKFLGV
ncbi:MAG: molecular chaperone DnaJ [Candidatus Babeliales bacterium]